MTSVHGPLHIQNLALTCFSTQGLSNQQAQDSQQQPDNPFEVMGDVAQ